MDDGSAGIGLRRGSVEVRAYDDRWPAYFLAERDLLLATLGSLILAIEHVGSTAVPGLSAKPLIDLQVAVAVVPALDSPAVAALQVLGYAVLPERRYPDRQFLPKGPERLRTHHLNLVAAGSDAWWQPLRFRDALRGDDTLRDEYAALKQALAAEHPDDRQTYTDRKAAFIARALGRA